MHLNKSSFSYYLNASANEFATTNDILPHATTYPDIFRILIYLSTLSHLKPNRKFQGTFVSNETGAVEMELDGMNRLTEDLGLEGS